MAEIQIIPKPVHLAFTSGTFSFHPATQILHDAEHAENARYLQARLAEILGYSLTLSPANAQQKAGILLRTASLPASLGQEGYRLTIEPESIKICASTVAGVFYGIQSLLQMVTGQHSNAAQVPCLQIEDSPRFGWRGYMLDEARHFQGMDTVKALLDEMARLKLNRFHWHLTDDQGWRIEIKQYPRLTEVGATRPGTATKNPFLGKTHNHVLHQGWYTQDQIREVVAYAAERHIMVIPEIEMPGHSSAALAAYPQYSCRAEALEVQTGFGIFPDIFCAGKEATYTFLENILLEVLELFPAPFLHIGGDEAPKIRWKNCPDCQRKMREAGLKSEHALQAAFTNRIARFLAESRRRVIMWSDSFTDEIDPTVIVHYWVGRKRQIAAALEEGRQMINSSYLRTYLDHTYRLLPLKRAYQFEPHFNKISNKAAANIWGLEGLMWGEWLPTRERLDYQTFPRLAALAEAGWSPKNQRDYKGFTARLPKYLQNLERRGFAPASTQQASPPWYRRILPHLTIARPKTSTAKEK